MNEDGFTLTAENPERTRDIARVVAPLLRPGDVILLEGPVGAGKTHFARCVIQSLLLCSEDIPSPTFTLVQSYEGRSGEIWHADLYRISDIAEIEELGLQQAFTDAICLIEWPDRLHDLTPASALHLQFELGDAADIRHITFEWSNARWTDVMEALRHDRS